MHWNAGHRHSRANAWRSRSDGVALLHLPYIGYMMYNLGVTVHTLQFPASWVPCLSSHASSLFHKWSYPCTQYLFGLDAAAKQSMWPCRCFRANGAALTVVAHSHKGCFHVPSNIIIATSCNGDAELKVEVLLRVCLLHSITKICTLLQPQVFTNPIVRYTTMHIMYVVMLLWLVACFDSQLYAEICSSVGCMHTALA